MVPGMVTPASIAQRDHGVCLSYSFVKPGPAGRRAGAQGRPRGRHRRRREPRPCFGELLDLDGSRHRWLALVPDTLHTLIAVVDDATKRLLYAHLLESGESVDAILTALRQVFTTYGIPGALYTDRAHCAVYTPTPAPARIAPGGPRSVGPWRAWASSTSSVTRPRPGGAASHQRHSARPPGQRAPRGRRHDAGRRQSLPARTVPARVQRHLQPGPGRSRQRLRARGRARPSNRSSVTRKNASSRGTTPSRLAASCCRSPSTGACAAAPACACSSVGISMGAIPSGGGRAVSVATAARAGSWPPRPPDPHGEKRSDHVSNASGRITCQRHGFIRPDAGVLSERNGDV